MGAPLSMCWCMLDLGGEDSRHLPVFLERPFAAPLRMQTLGGRFTLVVRRRVLYDYRPELYPYWFN